MDFKNFVKDNKNVPLVGNFRPKATAFYVVGSSRTMTRLIER